MFAPGRYGRASLVRTHVNPHGGLKHPSCRILSSFVTTVRTHVNPHGGLKPRHVSSCRSRRWQVRTHVNPHGGLKRTHKTHVRYVRGVRTHVNPHGGLKHPKSQPRGMRIAYRKDQRSNLSQQDHDVWRNSPGGYFCSGSLRC